MSGLDWPALMRVGIGRLGLPPGVFWAMTPREFRAAVEGAFGTGAEGVDAARLRGLMAAFPDARQGEGA